MVWMLHYNKGFGTPPANEHGFLEEWRGGRGEGGEERGQTKTQCLCTIILQLTSVSHEHGFLEKWGGVGGGDWGGRGEGRGRTKKNILHHYIL